jgi:hypothetical protein
MLSRGPSSRVVNSARLWDHDQGKMTSAIATTFPTISDNLRTSQYNGAAFWTCRKALPAMCDVFEEGYQANVKEDIATALSMKKMSR